MQRIDFAEPRAPLPRALAPMLTMLAALALFMTACGASAPTFRITDATVTDQSDQGVVVSFRIAAENRNPDPLPLREVRYSLAVNGRSAFEGRRSAQATLPAFGTQEIILPVSIPIGPGEALESMPLDQLPYAFSGSVEYVLPGTISEALFDSRIRVPKAGFAESGRLDFSSAGPMPLPPAP